MNSKMEISPEGLLKRFSREHYFNLYKEEMNTSQLSDALKHQVDYKWVIPGVKPLKDEFKIIGKAVTVQTATHDWGTALKAMDLAEEGDILFISTENIGSGNKTEHETNNEMDENGGAVWGELTSKTAQKKGLTGTVVYGAVRDVTAIKKLNYPVFTKSVVPHAGAPLAEGKVNVPLTCGGVTVNPQDMIIGDDCGVIVVRAEIFSRVMKEALNIRKDENEIIRKIENGWSLSKILDM